jgi:hypothetical protein
MNGKVGTAAGRSTNVEPTKTFFSGGEPAVSPPLSLLAQVSRWSDGTREKTGTIWVINDIVASQWGRFAHYGARQNGQ